MKSLFRLVHTLDKGERRFFKIYSSRHIIKGSNNDIELFNAIDKLNNPTDKELRNRIKNKTVVANLSLYKHLLYKNLLKCLNSYHAGKSAEDEVLELYKSAKVLYDKAQYNDSKKLVEKAKEIALQHECFSLYLLLAETENQIHERHFDVKEYGTKVIGGIKREYEIANKLVNVIKAREINNDLYYHSRIWGVIDEELNKRHNSDGLIKELDPASKNLDSVKAKLITWKAASLMAYRSRNFELSNTYEKKIMAILQKQQDNYPNKTQWLLTTLDSMIWNYHVSANTKKVRDIIDQVNKIPNIDNNIKLIKVQLFVNYEILNKINFGYHLTSKELERKVLDAYTNYSGSISLQKQLIINYNLGVLFFCEQDYDSAEKWLQTLVENTNKKLDADVMISARLLNITVQYERGLYALLKYSILSTKRFIRKKRPLTEFEVLFFATISKLGNCKSDTETRKVLQKFTTEYDLLVAAGKPTNTTFPFQLWTTAKLKGCSLGHLILEYNGVK